MASLERRDVGVVRTTWHGASGVTHYPAGLWERGQRAESNIFQMCFSHLSVIAAHGFLELKIYL